MTKQHDHLPRLPEEYYRGQAYVHWTMTTRDRATGWLIPIFYYKFREILTHTVFRYGLTCPIYCCMPDHVHFLWIEYIARNPERANLVRQDGYRDYKYTGCLIPGYPELIPWSDDYWDRFWRTYSYVRTNGLIRGAHAP